MPNFRNLEVEMSASLTHQVTAEEVAAFAKLTGDSNPIHVQDSAARDYGFTGPIVHGMLVASFFSTLIGRDLPGPGSIYLGQSLKFLAPLLVGESVIATVIVKSIRSDKPIVTLSTTCHDLKGRCLVDGEAIIKMGMVIT